jgi:glycosyltransferase involved in cell wall biosynthesis
MRRAIWTIGSRLPGSVRRFVKIVPGSQRLRKLATGRPGGPAPESGTPRPVVYLPTWARWDVMRQRPQFLLEAFAGAGHPVYFVDPREKSPRTVGGVSIVPSLDDVPGNQVILYIHFAPLRELVEQFDDAVVVYDILDDLTIYEADEVGLPAERTVAHHHPFLMDRADQVIVSNPVLDERHRSEWSDLILVENGVDVARFSESTPRPADLPNADGPVIGYRGAIAQWFDFDLLRTVAEAEPDWRFVLVGPIDRRVTDRARSLSALPNVEFIGERGSDEMPGYAQAFDVEAVWFVVDELTQGVTPLKVFEALAAGTPVVSTPLPACESIPGVRTAAEPSAFRDGLHAALQDTVDPEWRTQAAATANDADWSRRLFPLLERLDDANQRAVP